MNTLHRLAVILILGSAAQAQTVLFSDPFNAADALITNEFAYYNPSYPGAVISPRWAATSGSLFNSGNAAWTGVADDVVPNVASSNGTGSAVFRAITQQASFGDVSVRFNLRNQGLTSTPTTPAVSWDGVHVFLRYQSQFSLYYVSVNRRDNRVVIKKKVPGGPSNGGTYYDLSGYPVFTVPYNTWQSVNATVKTNANGTVTIELFINGALKVSATDAGIGGPVITAPGRTGIRADNCNLQFDDFTVISLATADTTAPVISGVAATEITANTAAISWMTSEPANSQIEYGLTAAYGSQTTLDADLKTSHSQIVGGLTASSLYHFRVKSVDAANNVAASSDQMFTTAAAPDATPPSVAITQPHNGAHISGTAALAATASDNVGVVSVQFKVDGAALGAALAAPPYALSWDTKLIGNGWHTLTAVATDAANNATTSAGVVVRVRNKH